MTAGFGAAPRAFALAAAMLAGAGGVASAEGVLDDMVWFDEPVPAAVAEPVELTVGPGMLCEMLPCPYLIVADASGSVRVGVEGAVQAPDDAALGPVDDALWAEIVDGGEGMASVQGYIIDRPRPEGEPELQRVLVVTAAPFALPVQ